MKPEFLFLDQEYGCDSKDGECSWLNDKGDTQVTLTIRSREPISLSRYALKSGATKDKRDPKVWALKAIDEQDGQEKIIHEMKTTEKKWYDRR